MIETPELENLRSRCSAPKQLVFDYRLFTTHTAWSRYLCRATHDAPGSEAAHLEFLNPPRASHVDCCHSPLIFLAPFYQGTGPGVSVTWWMEEDDTDPFTISRAVDMSLLAE
jgi:hypothetical protein